MKQDFLWTLGLMARQAAKAADRDPSLNDFADNLYVSAVKCGVPDHLLPK